MTDNKVRYSDDELQEFRAIIEDKIAKAQEDLELLESSYKNDSNNAFQEV